jgi:hypothetical protein
MTFRYQLAHAISARLLSALQAWLGEVRRARRHAPLVGHADDRSELLAYVGMIPIRQLARRH